MARRRLKVIVRKAPEGGFWAEVPELPGCMTQGETEEELRQNVRDAIESWLAAQDEDQEPVHATWIVDVPTGPQRRAG